LTRRPIDARTEPASGLEDDRARLRDAFTRWTSGVTLVAVRHESGVHGLTVSAFLPLSLDPPLVLVSIHGDAPLLSPMREVRRFTVNVLEQEQRRLATRFSDRFPVERDVFAESGDPALPGALAVFVCRVGEIIPAGDHQLVTGEVERVVMEGTGQPLLFGERTWRVLG
jgi:flavin reductase (DIM6/NTAB) family NADH-FMN oxidoreductase RutF